VSTIDEDSFYTGFEFQNFFLLSPQSLVLKADPPRFTILAVSDLYLKLVHKQRHELLGNGLFEVFPGNQSDTSEQHSVAASFERVLQTGKPDELPLFKYEIFIVESAQMQTFYWSNLNEPIINEKGVVSYLINTTTNVTELVKQRQALGDAQQREQALNEELAATNEELTSMNEELASSNEEIMASNEELRSTNAELGKTQRHLQGTLSQLQISQDRFQNLVREATIGIIVLMGDELKVEIVNKTYAMLIGRSVEDLLHNNLFEIIPEAKATFGPIIANVLLTGVTQYLYDTPYQVYNNGVKINGYLNLVYQPYIENDQRITGVIVLCQDVTEQVRAKHTLESAYEQLRLSKEAAQLGYFDMDVQKGTLEWDARCRLLFGISHNNEVNFEKDFVAGLHSEDRERIIKIINDVFIKSRSGGIYDVEYRTVGAEDNRVRWVRAKGQTYFDEQENPLRFIGSVMDITEQKMDEQRKNDFISMVSHELKTPLTTIKGYVQILGSKAGKSEDSFGIAILDKAHRQVNKMTTLINGFLNVSRLESGKIHIESQVFDMAALVQEVEQESITMIVTHKVVFAPVVEIIVNGDRDKIGQVINNLISNAVKYSPLGSTINITCVRTDGKVLVSVKDEGIGIAPQDKDKLFERYYRVESKNMDSISGFGIGLYLSSEIIERHGGIIGLHSTLGLGSTFWFTLPIYEDI
jgi:two-component system sensor histidine kinase VicK